MAGNGSSGGMRGFSGGVMLLWLAGLLLGAAAGGATTYVLVNSTISDSEG